VATALNPTVLLEVTSDSSEEYDTGDKLAAYQTIPSLQESIVVSHRERRITVHRRGEDGRWSSRVAVGGGRVPVPSVGADLVVDEIYRASAIR
jgi:Uma2 family endonuclease